MEEQYHRKDSPRRSCRDLVRRVIGQSCELLEESVDVTSCEGVLLVEGRPPEELHRDDEKKAGERTGGSGRGASCLTCRFLTQRLG